jgi:hypothetical protein
MTSACFKAAMAALGYDDIRTTWIRLPNIARINITTNATLYREELKDITAYYHYYEGKNLLFKAVTNPDGSVIGVT